MQIQEREDVEMDEQPCEENQLQLQNNDAQAPQAEDVKQQERAQIPLRSSRRDNDAPVETPKEL